MYVYLHFDSISQKSKQAKERMGRTSMPLSINQKSKKITRLSPANYDQYLMVTLKARESSLDPGDWRAQLHPDSRQRMVNKITKASKRHLLFACAEEEYQIERTAARFEEDVYASATSQRNYLQEISLKLLLLKFNSQREPSYYAGGSNRLPNSVSTFQIGHADEGDWQEEVYLKIKAMKEMYFPELHEMLMKITAKVLEDDLLPQQLTLGQSDKLRIFQNMLERLIAFLQVSKNNIVPEFKEKLGSYEKLIINIIKANRPRKPVS